MIAHGKTKISKLIYGFFSYYFDYTKKCDIMRVFEILEVLKYSVARPY